MEREWLWQIAARKVLTKLAHLGVAWLASRGASQVGVNLDPDLVGAGLFSGLELGRGWLKVKTGWRFL